MKKKYGLLSIALLLSLTNAGAKGKTDSYNEYRNAYFGQTHQHTGWSFDAFIYNVHQGPENAYRHARGDKVKHPYGYDVQLKVPLDFMMVSDHSEYLGVLRMMTDKNSPLYDHPLAKDLRDVGDSYKKGTKVFYGLVSETIQHDGSTEPDPALNTEEIRRTNWQEMVDIANKYYEPGKFTTFAGYEWSAQPDSSNLHRNIVFKGVENLPLPFSYFDSQSPEDLWNWMNMQREKGIDLLAISHNANLSNGNMFPAFSNKELAKKVDVEYAKIAFLNEPLVEIIQTKGQSETHPLMSPNDEFAGFELWTKAVAGPNKVKVVEGSYARGALADGLNYEKKLGVNPYEFGVVGGGDIHTSIVSHEEFAFTGEHNLKSSTPEQRLLIKSEDASSKIEQGSAGLSCVWAHENTRESIFDAMKRKETWATSGTRIKVRMFGGFGLDDVSPKNSDWLQKAYENGVPMGGKLKKNSKEEAPTFILWALKDPNSGNLDRIQVIKGWVDKEGNTKEKIYNVAWSEKDKRVMNKDGKIPPVKNTVNIKEASYENSVGATELMATWKDPDFNASESAVYYARVLEIPTPRWSTYDAKTLGIEPPKDFPATIQERAWTSAIWYSNK